MQIDLRCHFPTSTVPEELPKSCTIKPATVMQCDAEEQTGSPKVLLIQPRLKLYIMSLFDTKQLCWAFWCLQGNQKHCGKACAVQHVQFWWTLLYYWNSHRPAPHWVWCLLGTQWRVGLIHLFHRFIWAPCVSLSFSKASVLPEEEQHDTQIGKIHICLWDPASLSADWGPLLKFSKITYQKNKRGKEKCRAGRPQPWGLFSYCYMD